MSRKFLVRRSVGEEDRCEERPIAYGGRTGTGGRGWGEEPGGARAYGGAPRGDRRTTASDRARNACVRITTSRSH